MNADDDIHVKLMSTHDHSLFLVKLKMNTFKVTFFCGKEEFPPVMSTLALFNRNFFYSFDVI